VGYSNDAPAGMVSSWCWPRASSCRCERLATGHAAFDRADGRGVHAVAKAAVSPRMPRWSSAAGR